MASTNERSTTWRSTRRPPARRGTPRTATARRWPADIEPRWQERWDAEHTFEAPNPAGPLAEPDRVGGRPKLFILDMFPYPSGAGLHVGHPLGYIGTDVFGRYKRMTGYNVLHTLGYDAFGLPAEQYAVQTGTHPQVSTEENIANYRRQLRRLGLAHDPRRCDRPPPTRRTTAGRSGSSCRSSTSWYDADAGRARPIAELRDELAAGTRPTPDGRPWATLTPLERRRLVDDHRLAYLSEAPVNWCPGLGTVLANEEVTADGRSDRGNFPVFRRNMRQWMMRITAYADRLIADLDALDWPDSIKTDAAQLDRPVRGRAIGLVHLRRPGRIEVFTTRPDTLFGATYMVLAPEHPLVDGCCRGGWPERHAGRVDRRRCATPDEAVAAYRPPGRGQERPRAPGREPGQDRRRSSGAYAVNPVTGERIPVFIADYVLMGYGTGAIMAVPGQDQRDWEFAEAFDLPIVRTVAAARRLGGRGLRGRGSGHQQRQRHLPRRAGRRRRQAGDHRLAGGQRARRGHDHLQAARLAVQPPALLG